MRKITTVLALSALLTGCNNNQPQTTDAPSKNTEESQSTENEYTENWNEINSDEALIATALMAAPAESREGCKVIGYNMAGEFVTFREGTNEFICIADNPTQEGFSAACYHKSLEPFMARGRELTAEGKSHQEKFDTREEEAKAGTLQMPDPGATLHVYYGAKAHYNPETNEVADAQYRYVVYMPWATSESTGLPESPIAPNHPWIMFPGTHAAHIMITPLKGE